jgi:hypothetical protein
MAVIVAIVIHVIVEILFYVQKHKSLASLMMAGTPTT